MSHVRFMPAASTISAASIGFPLLVRVSVLGASIHGSPPASTDLRTSPAHDWRTAGALGRLQRMINGKSCNDRVDELAGLDPTTSWVRSVRAGAA